MTAQDFKQLARARDILERLCSKYLFAKWDAEYRKSQKTPISVDVSKQKGGHARAKALSPARRKEIAQRAARTRWGKL